MNLLIFTTFLCQNSVYNFKLFMICDPVKTVNNVSKHIIIIAKAFSNEEIMLFSLFT